MTKMTLQEFQDELHIAYQGDTDTPASSPVEEAWTVRLSLLKQAIREWASEKGITWAELWTTLTDAATGDKTVLAATLDYDCPTDFDFAGGFVRTGSSGNFAYWKVLPAEKAQTYLNDSMTACYFTGNASSGYTLHFLQQPTVGDTIDYPYYKRPTTPSATTDVIEMSDPMFAIYHVLSKMHEIDGEGDRAIKALRQAGAKMDGMRTRNVMPAFLQDNTIPDRQQDGEGADGFGG